MQYDTDVITWSPQGRLHQVEYAMEAVKQGSATVGLKVSFDSNFTPSVSRCIVVSTSCNFAVILHIFQMLQ